MPRKKLSGIDSNIYEHELDRKALEILKGTPGLEMFGKKFFEWGIERVYKINYTGSNIKVSENSFGDVYKLFVEACEILSIEKIPDFYIEYGYSINGFTIGAEKPIVVLNSGCFDLLSEGELLFIMGHELGHIKSGHCLFHTMAQVLPFVGGFIGAATLGLGELISSGMQLALLNWQRKSELTADRAGLLVCQDYGSVIGALTKMAGVPKRFYGKVSIEGFIKQAKEFEMLDTDKLDKIVKILSVMDNTHPWTIMRASEIISWVESGRFKKVVGKF